MGWGATEPAGPAGFQSQSFLHTSRSLARPTQKTQQEKLREPWGARPLRQPEWHTHTVRAEAGAGSSVGIACLVGQELHFADAECYSVLVGVILQCEPTSYP